LIDINEALGCEHFALPVLDAAIDLIGRTLVVRSSDATRAALIVETEAYGGPDDPASHAAFRPGGRAALMRGSPGLVYVYAAYGMYPCLNVVAEPEGSAAAVLIRAVVLCDSRTRVPGPGRTTSALGVTMADHGESVCGWRFAVSAGRAGCEIQAGPRVGVRRGADLPWRFVGRPVEVSR
jgi:DNA-3-methyladenine glycosylase